MKKSVPNFFGTGKGLKTVQKGVIGQKKNFFPVLISTNVRDHEKMSQIFWAPVKSRTLVDIKTEKKSFRTDGPFSLAFSDRFEVIAVPKNYRTPIFIIPYIRRYQN